MLLFFFLSGNEGLSKKLIISLTTITGNIIILGILVYGIHRKRSSSKPGKSILMFPSLWNNFDGINELFIFHLATGNETSSKFLPGSSLRSRLALEDQAELPMCDLRSILVATNNFSIANKLGQGGFGPVYRVSIYSQPNSPVYWVSSTHANMYILIICAFRQGKLHDGKHVAVKRLSSSSGQGIEEFRNEVMLISKLQHRNLVRLLGCCIEREEKILIYEFVANKSLDSFLFGTFH